MNRVFRDFDLSAVWQPKGYADKDYKEAPFTPEILAKVEAELGYTLPPSFTALMTVQNGGTFRNICFPTAQPNSWSENHVAVEEVSGIGFAKAGSLCGSMGQKLWLEEWGYPPIGVYFANDPTAGHAMFVLDYRQCGPHFPIQAGHARLADGLEQGAQHAAHARPAGYLQRAQGKRRARHPRRPR